MAKNGKLSKLRCMIKRWNSSNRIARADDGGGGAWSATSPEEDEEAAFHGDKIPDGFQPVYVGKSRRRYIVSSDLVGHPLLRNLIERSGSGGGGCAVIGCEVVLFQHLLWMLENADPQLESLDELAEFYAC